MRAIDADALTEDCKRYLGTLNPDKDGKECTRIHWLIGVLENAPTIDPEPCEDAVSRKTILDKINEVCFSRKQEWVDFRFSYGSKGQRDLIIEFIESLQSIQPRPSISENLNKCLDKEEE